MILLCLNDIFLCGYHAAAPAKQNWHEDDQSSHVRHASSGSKHHKWLTVDPREEWRVLLWIGHRAWPFLVLVVDFTIVSLIQWNHRQNWSKNQRWGPFKKQFILSIHICRLHHWQTEKKCVGTWVPRFSLSLAIFVQTKGVNSVDNQWKSTFQVETTRKTFSLRLFKRHLWGFAYSIIISLSFTFPYLLWLTGHTFKVTTVSENQVEGCRFAGHLSAQIHTLGSCYTGLTRLRHMFERDNWRRMSAWTWQNLKAAVLLLFVFQLLFRWDLRNSPWWF